MVPTVSHSLQGELFLYAQGRAAFESPTSLPNKCILFGGLSDGMMPVPYTTYLESELAKFNWSVVQPILSSSYTGFGHGSLDRDVAEIDELIAYLVETRGASRIAMVGHSTGTQDIVHFLKHGTHTSKVVAAALQAPVSDRESASICHGDETQEEHMKKLQDNLKLATTMRDKGHLGEMMPRESFWAPITASRYLALFERSGVDDYFSSDLTDAELRNRLSHLQHTTCLFAISGSDEYVPEYVDSKVLMQRLCQASGARDNPQPSLYLETGNHNLSSRDGADGVVFVDAFTQILSMI